MADDNKIGLQAVFEDEQFQKGIADYNSSVDKANANTSTAGSDMSRTWDGLSAVGDIAFGALVAGIAAMTAELYTATTAAMDTEEVLARMNFVVGNTSERTGIASEDVIRLADSISKVKPFDDEVVASAITMGLTFDGVTKKNIEPLINAAADLATWTGRDLPSTMKSLAMSISDPDKAMRLFREANITLTDAELKTFKGFKDTGDAAGATTFLLEQLRKKGVIGLADAMGQTAKGKMTIMKTALDNMQEALGAGLLNALSSVFDKITEFANNPQTVTFLTELGNQIGIMASTIIAQLPSIMTALDGLVNWFSNNKPLIVGVLAAIGVAMAKFAITAVSTAVSAAVSTIAALAPIIAVMAVVGLAAALVYKAWTENWGGVQQKVKAAWAQVKPVFDQLQKWMKDNLPKALAYLSDLWTKTLLPAIKIVFNWIVDNVIPILVKLVLWLGDNVPKAIKETSDWFNGTLVPAIKSVSSWFNDTLLPILKNIWDWLKNQLTNAIATLNAAWNTLMAVINVLVGVWNTLVAVLQTVYNFVATYIMPIFAAVANLIDAVLSVALRAMAGLWQNVLYPALVSVYNVIAANIIPIFNTIAGVISSVVKPAMDAITKAWQDFHYYLLTAWDAVKPFATWLSNTLTSAFQGVWNIIQKIISKIGEWADAIRNLKLPAWLTPGSPTPFEMGLRGINAELDKLATSSFPAIQHQLNVTGNLRDVASSSTSSGSNSVSNSQSTRNYIYGANFSVNGQSGMIEALQNL